MGPPGGGGPGGAPGAPIPAGMGGCCVINIVPLNFGADAPLRLNPHLTHVDAVSEFCVPQFGQNTHHLRKVIGRLPFPAGELAKVPMQYFFVELLKCAESR